MKIIAVANQKGGCGKTTTAVNLAYGLSLQKKKTLLLDCDPQHHASTALGYHDVPFTTLTAFDAIVRGEQPDLKNSLQHRNVFFSVLPSEFELGALEAELSNNQIALSLVEKLIAGIGRDQYDYLVIDCPPNLGFMTLNALKISDILIVPFDAGIFSLMGVDNVRQILSMLAEVTNHMPSIFHLLTIYDKRSNYARQFLSDARKRFGNQLFSTVIRANAHLKEAAADGKSVFEHTPKANGAQDYMNLTQELLRTLESTELIDFSVDGCIDARSVYVTGDFNGWQRRQDYALIRHGRGWKASFPLEKGTYRYKFVIDESWQHDHNNPTQEADLHGGYNSVLTL
jgi:chromosome partitioning protein